MIDIQYATAENRGGKKKTKEEEEDKRNHRGKI